MMFIPGLRREMRVVALLLIVYFMSLTWTVASSETTAPAPVMVSNVISTSIATSISPTGTKSTTTSSTTTSTTGLTSTVTEVPLKQQTTPAPTTTTGGRKFDGASFVGGIILGIVIAIIFILGFKWWQSRQKSYHSL